MKKELNTLRAQVSQFSLIEEELQQKTHDLMV